MYAETGLTFNHHHSLVKCALKSKTSLRLHEPKSTSASATTNPTSIQTAESLRASPLTERPCSVHDTPTNHPDQRISIWNSDSSCCRELKDSTEAHNDFLAASGSPARRRLSELKRWPICTGKARLFAIRTTLFWTARVMSTAVSRP